MHFLLIHLDNPTFFPLKRKLSFVHRRFPVNTALLSEKLRLFLGLVGVRFFFLTLWLIGEKKCLLLRVDFGSTEVKRPLWTAFPRTEQSWCVAGFFLQPLGFFKNCSGGNNYAGNPCVPCRLVQLGLCLLSLD